MHVSTNFGEEIREKKSPGTNGLTHKDGIYNKLWSCIQWPCTVQVYTGTTTATSSSATNLFNSTPDNLDSSYR